MNRSADGPERIDFDEFVESYDQSLHRGLSLSGESKDFFARGRIDWLRRCLGLELPTAILDYGCGTGQSSLLLHESLGARVVVGVDSASGAVAEARRHETANVHFTRIQEFSPAGEMDLAYSNGVFHHILPAERPAAVRYVRNALKPGGWFSFWENNPWNPGTRLVMSRIPFDRNAIPLSVLEATRLLRDCGFEVVSVDFLFIFPKVLRAFRRLEPALSRLPLGAQYQVLCRKRA